MARIQFQDGTFTTREPHEANPHEAVPEGAVLVDHGAVVTTGLPDSHPKTPLGADFEPMPEGVEVVDPENKEKVENEDKATVEVKPTKKVRAKSTRKKAEPQAAARDTNHTPQDHAGHEHDAPDRGREGATSSASLRPHHEPRFEMDNSGATPQGRIGLEDKNAEGRDSGGDQHPDRDND